MLDPFMNLRHCSQMAIRQALRSGDVFHVVATGEPDRPLSVLDEHDLFELGDQLGPEDLLFTADPFAAADTG